MNKNASKRTLGVIMLILIITVTGVIILTSWNPSILRGLVNDLESEIEATEGIELIETQSAYGKLNGNGNGFNYFGAALVKADDTAVLDELIKKLDTGFEIVGYEAQSGTKIGIKYLERHDLYYEIEPSADGYYTVYFYNSSHPHTNPLDPNGH